MSEAPAIASPRRGNLLPFAIVALIWGSTWLVIRGQLGIVPPTWSVCYRFLTAGVTMVFVARASGVSLRLRARDHLLLAGIGGTIFCLNFNFIYRAEAHVTSGVVAVTFSLLVVYNSILGRIFLRQPLSRRFLIGSAIAMAGVGLLFLHELRASARDPHDVMLGIGLTLGAMCFASIANVLQSGGWARTIAMPALVAWSALWGALFNAIGGWALSGPPRFEWTIAYVSGVLYLGVVASALAFTLYFNLIRRIGPAHAGYVNVLAPVLAMGLSTVFEQYRWSPAAAAGGALAVVGLAVATRARSPAR